MLSQVLPIFNLHFPDLFFFFVLLHRHEVADFEEVEVDVEVEEGRKILGDILLVYNVTEPTNNVLCRIF